MSSINADLSIPVPIEQPNSLVPHPEIQDDSWHYFSSQRGTKESCGCIPSFGTSTPQKDKELTLTNAYRQMDIQLVNSFSTTVSVLKESMRLVTGIQCRAGKDLEIKITLLEKRTH